MKFGPKQINVPTPQWIATASDFLVGFLSIVSSFISMASFIPKEVSDIVTPIISGLLVPLFLYMKRWFGSQVKSTVVSIDNVSEIKEDPSDQTRERGHSTNDNVQGK